jgi:uncharacterized protein YukE
MDHNIIADRIKELKDNYQAGQAQLRNFESQQKELQQTMLRISGAIQALQELLEQVTAAPAPADGTAQLMHIAR